MSGDLCEDLIFEIFTRLPFESLLRFRSVSKSLCSLIASPSFIRMHSSRSPQKVVITHRFYCKGEYEPQSFYTLHSGNQLPSCPRRGYNGIPAVEFTYRKYSQCVGSCNGIFCLLEYENGKHSYNLWNPIIRRKLALPDCPRRCMLGSDPIRIGFGFDPIADDFKIVSLSRYGGSSYVYTIKTGACCAIASPTPWFCNVISRGCFVNRALHWVVERALTKSNAVVRFFILSFDLSTHVFNKIALPEPSWEIQQLTTIQGALAVISTKCDYIWIWVMRGYNDTASWSVFHKLKTNQVQGRILQPTNNGDFLFVINRESFQVYDPKKGAQSRLVNLGAHSRISDIQMCVESLGLIDMGTTCGDAQLSILGGRKRRKIT